jgi:hypothetical protein
MSHCITQSVVDTFRIGVDRKQFTYGEMNMLSFLQVLRTVNSMGARWDRFMDLGCGRASPVLLASQLGFTTAHGVELLSGVHGIARGLADAFEEELRNEEPEISPSTRSWYGPPVACFVPMECSRSIHYRARSSDGASDESCNAQLVATSAVLQRDPDAWGIAVAAEADDVLAVFASDEEVLVQLRQGELVLPLRNACASRRKGLLILRSSADPPHGDDCVLPNFWLPKVASISLLNEDILRSDCVGCDVIYIASTCFPPDMMAQIRDRLADQVSSGAWVITLHVALPSPEPLFTLRKTLKLPMSWGISNVFLHERQ